MPATIDPTVLMVAIVGVLIILAPLVGSLCARLHIPALVGYLCLGFALRLLDQTVGLLIPPVTNALHFLAGLGIVALLFSVGIESHPNRLAEKLPSAARVWLADVAISGGLGFLATYALLGFSLVSALICTAAFTATSVGVSVGIWREAGALDSEEGQLLLDVAELDDISAMALMTLVFAVTPVLIGGNGLTPALVGSELVNFLVRALLFLAICLLFARYLEHRVTAFAQRLPRPPERMLIVAGFGFVIAALGGVLGFSLAIGAFFAGLAFSRDPKAVRTERSFQDVYALVTPFFFIDIGLGIDPAVLTGSMGLAGALLLVAIAGKFTGNFLAALLTTTAGGATLIGLSMVPRAEIAMVILNQGNTLVPDEVTGEIYAAAVLAFAATCLLAPLLAGPLLRSHPMWLKRT